MRTTLTLDDDLAAILQRESRRRGLSFREVVNSTLRRGLTQDRADRALPKVVTRPHSFGFLQGIDPDKMNQLADELEAGDFASRHRNKG